jgi:pimeloyl-ACP methyl ester carboxylesterase
MKPMARAALDGIELEYEVQGAGEPVVLVHAGLVAEWFRPLLQERVLTEQYQVVSYHRLGYAGSSRVAGPVSIAQQAAYCRALMHSLGIARAHVVGHSLGANIALQLALDAPDAVHSLALLEPARPLVPGATASEYVRAIYEPAFAHYRSGDQAGAVETFMRGVCGPAYRSVLERVLPGAFEQAVADAETFFGQDQPAVQQWSFTRQEASRIAQPVLAVIGARSWEVAPFFEERQELLLAWFPQVEPFVLPEATHLLQVQNPGGMAQGLAAFFARHSFSVSP